ncbi:MAG: DUF4097 family beta strand repeat-containing protein [Bacteroidota bacterium]
MKNQKDMKLKTYSIGFFLFALLPLAAFANKSDYEAKKHFEETYSISKNHTLEIEGSFASFEVVTWNQNEVHISGDITITAKNQAKADQLLNEYEVKMSNSGDKVSLSVRLESKNKDKNSSKMESDVKFTIKAPEWLKLDAHVAFGNLDLARNTAENAIEMEYGNLSATALDGANNMIHMSFGNVNMENFGGGDLTALFSKVEIDEVKGNSKIESSYSTCQIHAMNANVKEVTIGNSFGDTSLSIPAQNSYEIESSSSFGSMKVKGPWNEKYYKSEFDSEQKKGTFGNGAVIGSITVNNSFGSVKVLEK